MWPWEHLAFGYVLYTVATRLLSGSPPSDGAALALAVGTQFPDLVDKPLAWVVGILPSGVSLAHSLLFAVPGAGVAALVARRLDRPAVGAAFAVGYLSHLAGDVLYPVLLGGDPSVAYLLWPLVENPGKTAPVLTIVGDLFGRFLEFLATPRGRLYLLGEATFLLVALGLWVWDGFPGPGLVRRRPGPSQG